MLSRFTEYERVTRRVKGGEIVCSYRWYRQNLFAQEEYTYEPRGCGLLLHANIMAATYCSMEIHGWLIMQGVQKLPERDPQALIRRLNSPCSLSIDLLHNRHGTWSSIL